MITIPPDLELAIASQLDAERQYVLALQYLDRSRLAVSALADQAGWNPIDLSSAVHQMKTDHSAKQINKLRTD